MLQGAVDDIGDNLHVAMPVLGEPGSRLDDVVVDHPQRTEPHVLGIVVLRERERVAAIEPAVIGVSARQRGTDGERHFDIQWR